MSFVTYRTEVKTYHGLSAVEVVQALERDAAAYPERGAPLARFLTWSLSQFADTIPPRDRLVSPVLSDETLALWFLAVCEEYGLGSLSLSRREAEAGS